MNEFGGRWCSWAVYQMLVEENESKGVRVFYIGFRSRKELQKRIMR